MGIDAASDRAYVLRKYADWKPKPGDKARIWYSRQDSSDMGVKILAIDPVDGSMHVVDEWGHGHTVQRGDIWPAG